MQSFAASVRLAREWIVESAESSPMYRELERNSSGLLSLARRKMLLESIDRRGWSAVWQSVSVSDLHFLGDALAQHAPKELWVSPTLISIKQAAAHDRELDALGSVAPTLNGLFIEALRPGDSVSVHSFTGHLSELSEMTTDGDSSRRSLTRLRVGGRTALFDAISQAAFAMEKIPGKKAIIVLTDGGDNASILNRQSAARRAAQSRRAGLRCGRGRRPARRRSRRSAT